MMGTVETALANRSGIGPYRELARQAGVDAGQFAEDVALGGLNATLRRYAERADRRRRDPRRALLELRRRQ